MKKILIVMLFAVACLVWSCKKEQAATTITMTYQMSQCADPWMQEAGYFDNKTGVLKQFLINRGISVSNLSITTDCGSAAVCLACNCAGCDKATAEVDETNVAAMIALGFKR